MNHEDALDIVRESREMFDDCDTYSDEDLVIQFDHLLEAAEFLSSSLET